MCYMIWQMMGGSNFLNNLLQFPKDMINEEMAELLIPYLSMEDFNLESAKKVCGNVAGLCSWVIAMYNFYGINKEVLPLKVTVISTRGHLRNRLLSIYLIIYFVAVANANVGKIKCQQQLIANRRLQNCKVVIRIDTARVENSQI